MACTWKGKEFEPYTIPLLAMLVQENGTLDGTSWHDCFSNGICHGLPLTGHSICSRGAPDGKKYCYWTSQGSPQARFKAKYPELSTDWRAQFYHFSDWIRQDIADGKTADQIIWSWNSKEARRRAKVERWEDFVRLALGEHV